MRAPRLKLEASAKCRGTASIYLVARAASSSRSLSLAFLWDECKKKRLSVISVLFKTLGKVLNTREFKRVLYFLDAPTGQNRNFAISTIL